MNDQEYIAINRLLGDVYNLTVKDAAKEKIIEKIRNLSSLIWDLTEEKVGEQEQK